MKTVFITKVPMPTFWDLIPPVPNTSNAKLTFWYFIPPYVDFSPETAHLLANSILLLSISMSNCPLSM